jgi:ABC-type multidrug transport system fused ATPase/permease subunit
VQARTGDTSSLRHLGAGGASDRLGFRVVIRILLRCLPFLRPVAGHLTFIVLGWGALIFLIVPPVLLFLDLIWTRALQGEALAPLQATLLGFDPAETVSVEALSPEIRRSVMSQTTGWGILLSLPLAALAGGLYYYQVWVLQQINQLLRVRLLDRIQTLSLRFHAESRVGDAIYRIYQDSAMVTALINVLFLTPLGAIVRYLSALLVVTLFFDWRLGLMLFAIAPGLLLIGFGLSQSLRVGFRRAREANSALTSRIQESLNGIKIIKAYGAESFERERFERASLHAFSEAFGVRSLYALFGVLIFSVMGAGLIGSAAFAAVLSRNGGPLLGASLTGLGPMQAAVAGLGLSAWTLGVYNGLKWIFGEGAGGLRRLLKVWGRTQDTVIGLDRVFELLDLEPEVEDAPDAIEMPPFRSTIEFRGVRFRYEPTRPVLERVDLVARAGTVTAIVGPTGSGKSTLMALLLRLFDPDSGEILLDGRNLRTLRLESLRQQIAIALQENLLFGSTVRENIAYAVPHATDVAVREAARVACADTFIEKLPEGYDTLLGERGTKLSTGQRQRISIARAILKNAPVLILDEPTASLDAETELRLLRNLTEWGKERAVFLITHRLSTIRRADQIVFLDQGRVRETGSHEELMHRSNGVYRALIETEETHPFPAAEGRP